MVTRNREGRLEAVAVIGISARYPGARNTAEFWKNLTEGRETISFFSDQELRESGFDPEDIEDPSFVKARGTYEKPLYFDASFFGYTPREAEVIDPQQRIFLECAWEALEDAGYDPLAYPGRIGLFGGVGMTHYFFHLMRVPALASSIGGMTLGTSNEKDYLATRIGYKLNLRGPCVTVQTACSTSLVAVVLGSQSLLTFQSDIALAGGVTVIPNERGGYQYVEGGITSPDGHTRSFDAQGKGTVFGCGAGIVVLKRLTDALADGDTIHGLIRGFGMNNDGSAKVGFTAPGVEGQVAVALNAIEMAGTHPETIGFIECHGTATPLGDLVEMTALTRSFRTYTEKKRFCAVGSVKSNFGHMDAAAGVAGLTKALLALEHKLIPPTINFERPNPQIDFDDGPFYVNTTLAAWERGETPRRAGVSSFGIGGTNAHVIVEEAPEVEPSSTSRPCQLLVWSAKTASALDTMTTRLATFLREHPETNLADAAYTLQVGRRVFPHRRMLVSRSLEDAARTLDADTPGRIFTLASEGAGTPVAFLFPGQGAQHPNMGKELYRTEPTFREQVDLCAGVLEASLGLDLRELLYPEESRFEEAAQQLAQTRFTQPALFVIEYALARLWMEWGLRPEAMVGHSIGEYVAACLAGVFSLEDALRLVAARGRLMQQLPAGTMVGVLMSEREARAWTESIPALSLAAVNGPSTCVLSGTMAAAEQLEQELAAKNVPCRRLHTSHAFHSAMMDPVLGDFRQVVGQVNLEAPTLPYLSNVTGTWITTADAADPDYWVRHLRQTVRFSDGAAEVLKDPQRVLLEVGPGRTLSTLLAQHPDKGADRAVLPSLPHPKQDAQTDLEFLLTSMGKLWLEGVQIDWPSFHRRERRRRIPLPTYPFEREKYLIPAPPRDAKAAPSNRKKSDVADWFYYPSWKRSAPALAPQLLPPGVVLLFLDPCGVGSTLSSRLTERGQDVVLVSEGDEFARGAPDRFTIRPGKREDYGALLKELGATGRVPSHVVHCWGVTPAEHPQAEIDCVEGTFERGFYSLFYLAPPLSTLAGAATIQLHVVTSDMHDVGGEHVVCPAKAAVMGPCRAIPGECPNLECHSIDIHLSDDPLAREAVIEGLLAELAAPSKDEVVAYRGGHRWVQVFEPIRIETPADGHTGFREQGVYLITGGLGGIGLALAEQLARDVRARLALFSRSPFPEREEWEGWRASHPDGDRVSEKIRQLLRLEELGAEVATFSADVADPQRMRQLVDRVRQRFGTIHGAIHTAGVAGGGIMELKTRETAEGIFAPKVKGTLVLEKVLEDFALDFFIVCSSLTAIVGEGGQSDYTAANAFLDAFAYSRRAGRRTAPVSIDWDRWDDVGMVAVDKPAVRAAATSHVEARPGFEHMDDPIFVGRFREDDRETYVAYLSPSTNWVVGEHKLMGVPTLVGTAYLQLAQAAFARQRSGSVEIRDVLFVTPLTVKEGEKKEVHVVLKPAGDFFEFQVKSRSAEWSWQDHAIGKIGSADGTEPAAHDIQALLGRCRSVPEAAAPEVAAPEMAAPAGKAAFLEFGPRWRNVTAVSVGTNEAVAKLDLPIEFVPDLDHFQLHPALLDTATAFAVQFAGKGGMYLPFGYNRVRVTKPLAERVYSAARYLPAKGPQDDFISLDLAILDEHGNELIQIDGYEMKRVPDSFLKANDPAVLARDQGAAAAAKGPARRDKTQERILSKEGAEVFRRVVALGSRMPQVVIAAKDLEAIRTETKQLLGKANLKAAAAAGALKTAHPRPNLATPYLAPRSELEQSLSEIWQTLLGIDRVGAHDNFVELGGHSLLAIQVASRVRETFEIELSVASLYKAPTVAELAEAVVQALAGQADSATLAQALQEIEALPGAGAAAV